MRILIVPLPALAPTQGSQLRVRQLITGFRAAGFEVATCAAEDLNFKKQEGIINHGGQNSIMDALQYGVPQLICPGKVFERKYNAHSITSREAGITLSEKAFYSKEIKASVTKLINKESYKQNSQKLWQEIKELGGAARIVELIKENKGKCEDKG